MENTLPVKRFRAITRKKEPAGMPATSSVSVEPKSEASKTTPAPESVTEAPKMDTVSATAEKTPASEHIVSQTTMPASTSIGVPSDTVKGTPEKIDTVGAVTDRDTLDLIDEQNQINALKKNMKRAFKNPKFAKLAGLSVDDVSDFKDSYYERGGFDEKDYNEVVKGYKSIGLSPQSFRKEVSGYPGVESAIKSALEDDEIKALLKDIGINENALSDTLPTDDGDDDYHEAIDYLLEHIYENGTPEQIQKFGKQLRSSAFNEAASNIVYRNKFKKNKK